MITTPHIGLKVWNLTTDRYDSGQLADNFARLDEHDHSSGKGKQIGTAGIEDGSITTAKLAPDISLPDGTVETGDITPGAITYATLDPAIIEDLGLSGTGGVRRGVTSITTEQSTSSTVYTLLSTADRVANVVLPTDGLMFIAYRAMWKNSVVEAGSAAIFLGANQLKTGIGAGSPEVLETILGSAGADEYAQLFTSDGDGLDSLAVGSGYTGDVTTGQVLTSQQEGSGVVAVFAAAGTYDVSIQFKASSGSVTAKNRTLRVWTMGF